MWYVYGIHRLKVTSTEKNLAVNRLMQLRSEYGIHKDAEKSETIRNGMEQEVI